MWIGVAVPVGQKHDLIEPRGPYHIAFPRQLSRDMYEGRGAAVVWHWTAMPVAGQSKT